MWLWVVLLSPERENGKKNYCCRCHFAGRNQQLLLVYGVGTGYTSPCVMSVYRLCLPGTERPVKRLGHGADSPAAEHRLCEPRCSCVSRNMTSCRGACERKLRVNAPTFPRNCGLFVRLPSPDNGRLELVLVTPVGTQLRNLQAAVSDWSVPLRPKSGRHQPNFVTSRVFVRLRNFPNVRWPRVYIWPNGLRCSAGPPGSGARPSGCGPGPPASSPFYPEECHRFSARAGPVGVSPLTWTVGCARCLFGIQLAGLFCRGNSVYNGPGRHWASWSTTGPIIRAPNVNDGWTVANHALVI